MKKSIVPTIVLGCILLTVPVFAKKSCTVNYQDKEKIVQYNNQGNREIVPYDMFIDSGHHIGTAFAQTYSLKKSNGSTVNFWIRNNGRYPVVIKINGSNAAIIGPGGQGHTSESVGWFSSNYRFTASCTEGGDVDIDYRIAQRD